MSHDQTAWQDDVRRKMAALVMTVQSNQHRLTEDQFKSAIGLLQWAMERLGVEMKHETP